MIEPDMKFGRGYLEVVAQVIKGARGRHKFVAASQCAEPRLLAFRWHTGSFKGTRSWVSS